MVIFTAGVVGAIVVVIGLAVVFGMTDWFEILGILIVLAVIAYIAAPVAMKAL